MRGVADSLNVSVTAAVLLYEARRQRDPARRPHEAADSMETFDFVIIGAGPAGEAAANKARERGASVAVIDRRWFGGSCPHIGCIPSKSLLNAAAAPRGEPGRLRLAAGVGAPRLHGQPRRGRPRARRLQPRRGAGGGRRRVYRGGARITAAAGSPVSHDGADPRLEATNVVVAVGSARRCRRSRASPTSRSGRTGRRRSPASCRRACSCWAAARPAASSPRSTPGSTCR